MEEPKTEGLKKFVEGTKCPKCGRRMIYKFDNSQYICKNCGYVEYGIPYEYPRMRDDFNEWFDTLSDEEKKDFKDRLR